MSGLVAFLAAVIRFVRAPSSGAAAFAATIAGLLATLRATGFVMLPVLMVMVGLSGAGWQGSTGASTVGGHAADAGALDR
jgi:hypothetical protein